MTHIRHSTRIKFSGNEPVAERISDLIWERTTLDRETTDNLGKAILDHLVNDLNLLNPNECDDCHRTDGTHDPEVEH